MKVGIVQAVIGAIVAEWMSGKQGLGYILTYASSTYDTPMLLAGIIVTIVLGIATYQVISVLEDKFLYWHESKELVLRTAPASEKCGVLNKRRKFLEEICVNFTSASSPTMNGKMPHIQCTAEEIGEIVLLPGDPATRMPCLRIF